MSPGNPTPPTKRGKKSSTKPSEIASFQRGIRQKEETN